MQYNEIVNEAKEYINAFHSRNDRYAAWTTGGKADFVKQELEAISQSIIDSNDYFKSNLYVQDSFPKISHNGKNLYCKPMRAIILFSGKVVAQGYGGEDQTGFYTITENGFQIHFAIALSGKINVTAYGHSIEEAVSQMKLIETVDHPNELTSEKIQKLVLGALKFAKSTCFLFGNE